MAQINSITFDPPLINTSCAWASELHQLRELYDCVYIGGITTRTATLNGFNEDASNTVAFTKDSVSSINSYGYSPNPLHLYLEWVYSLLTTPNAKGDGPSKPIIISITSADDSELSEMVQQIQALRQKLHVEYEAKVSRPAIDPSTLIAVELNTSCPNIKDHPPPAYDFISLTSLLEVFANAFSADSSLTFGLKLPPYMYSTLFDDAVSTLASFSKDNNSNPFAFITCTNTLGSSLLFEDQVLAPTAPGKFALPTSFGGLAGEALHSLALGNVYGFSQRFANHQSPAIRKIVVIGAGGVTRYDAVARMHAAGATIVGCATLLGKEGISAFKLLTEKP
ncbi:hypothetical protein C8Q75DRAFT_721667 [Abortiporus biennis]|nr:hypothetical protein C8Q75DRAFT_721667 [Abortiporus biennis]